MQKSRCLIAYFSLRRIEEKVSDLQLPADDLTVMIADLWIAVGIIVIGLGDVITGEAELFVFFLRSKCIGKVFVTIVLESVESFLVCDAFGCKFQRIEIACLRLDNDAVTVQPERMFSEVLSSLPESVSESSAQLVSISNNASTTYNKFILIFKSPVFTA